MKPKFILLGLLLILLSACQPNKPRLLVTVTLADVYGQTAICSIEVDREEDVLYLFLTEGDDNLFGIQLADGQPCGIIPQDQYGNNLIADWEVSVINQSNQNVVVRGETLSPGEGMMWSKDSVRY